MLRRLFILTLIIGWTTNGLAEGASIDLSDLFPKPVSLVPQVEFWKMVYTQFSTRQALIHDNRDLTVIYDVVSLPSPNWKTAKSAAQSVADHYRSILEGLATGPVDSLLLSGDERRVWELWNRSLDPEVYKKASASIRVTCCPSLMSVPAAFFPVTM